jgi:Rod binding domain-containing protein
MRIDSALSAKAAAAGIAPAELQKLHKSAREFEGMLLSALWKDEQASMQANEADGDETLGGMKGPLQDLAFQAIATKAANSGGFGIARMIEQSLVTKLAAGHKLSGTDTLSPQGHIPVEPADSLGIPAKLAGNN